MNDMQCLKCGNEDHPDLMGVWRDADGSGHWLHPWCDETVWATMTETLVRTPQ